MYLEYCGHGDLHELLNSNKFRQGLRDEAGNYLQAQIPEDALWRILEALVCAATVMEDGRAYDEPDLEEGVWPLPIVHPDMKPANIFLGPRDPENWPDFPTVKLGDFGEAFEKNRESDVDYIYYYALRGTKGFRAPEQHVVPVDELKPLGWWTHVWAIGNIIISLMNLDPRPKGGDSSEPHITPVINDPTGFYSAKLTELMNHCTQVQTSYRPSLEKLWDRTMEVTGGSTQRPRQKALRFQRRPDGLNYKDDNYLVGSNR